MASGYKMEKMMSQFHCVEPLLSLSGNAFKVEI